MDERTNARLPNPQKWRLIWLMSLVASVVTSVLMAHFFGNRISIYAIGALLGWFLVSLAFMNLFGKRVYGIRVEKSAIRIIEKVLPTGWRIMSGIPTGDGDLDIFLVSASGERFAVEVKSQRKVAVQGWFTPRLVLLNGNKFRRDPVLQAKGNASKLNAVPILWFPMADSCGVKRIGDVTVVLGGRKTIARALGIRNGWSLF